MSKLTNLLVQTLLVRIIFGSDQKTVLSKEFMYFPFRFLNVQSIYVHLLSLILIYSIVIFFSHILNKAIIIYSTQGKYIGYGGIIFSIYYSVYISVYIIYNEYTDIMSNILFQVNKLILLCAFRIQNRERIIPNV